MFSHIERALREKIAQEIEAVYMMATFSKYEEGFDDGLKEAVFIVRGKNEYRDSVLKEENEQIRD